MSTEEEINRIYGSPSSRFPSTEREIANAYSQCSYCMKYGHRRQECKELPANKGR